MGRSNTNTSCWCWYFRFSHQLWCTKSHGRYFSGLFIIFERQFEVGDYIEVAGHEGIVKEISLRITKIENLEGDTVILNNSDIRSTINSSSGFSPAVCDISISYSADLEKVEKIIFDNLEDIKEKIPAIKGGIYYKGVQTLGESSVVLRVIGMVEETDKRQTARNLNRELKILFDKHNIEIPFNQLVIIKQVKNRLIKNQRTQTICVLFLLFNFAFFIKNSCSNE